MRKRSPAKIAASSPPVPPRISRIAFLSSCGSAGMSSSFISSSVLGISFSHISISSRAISRRSASFSLARISLASLNEVSNCIYRLRASSISSSSRYSLLSLTYRFMSATTAGSVMSVDTSWNLASRSFSFISSELFSIVCLCNLCPAPK